MTTEQGTQQVTAPIAAARWWAEQVGAPVFKVIRGDEDDRQSQDFGGITSLMAGMLADRHPVADGQGERFVEALSSAIAESLNRSNWLSLGVDYGPDRMLALAAEASGIHPSRFPYKTHMSITPQRVVAALGYGARGRLVWGAPDWVRPACGQHEHEGHFAREGICTRPQYHDGECGDYIPDPARCVRDCTYVDHFGSDERLNHSWEPASNGD